MELAIRLLWYECNIRLQHLPLWTIFLTLTFLRWHLDNNLTVIKLTDAIHWEIYILIYKSIYCSATVSTQAQIRCKSSATDTKHMNVHAKHPHVIKCASWDSPLIFWVLIRTHNEVYYLHPQNGPKIYCGTNGRHQQIIILGYEVEAMHTLLNFQPGVRFLHKHCYVLYIVVCWACDDLVTLACQLTCSTHCKNAPVAVSCHHFQQVQNESALFGTTPPRHPV